MKRQADKREEGRGRGRGRGNEREGERGGEGVGGRDTEMMEHRLPWFKGRSFRIQGLLGFAASFRFIRACRDKSQTSPEAGFASQCLRSRWCQAYRNTHAKSTCRDEFQFIELHRGLTSLWGSEPLPSEKPDEVFQNTTN